MLSKSELHSVLAVAAGLRRAPRGVQATWYALVANAEFMLHDVQNEALAEQLRERKRLFGEQSRKLDFFLVSEPAWLDAKFPQEAAKVRRPCVALVSTDKIWITCAPRPHPCPAGGLDCLAARSQAPAPTQCPSAYAPGLPAARAQHLVQGRCCWQCSVLSSAPALPA